MIRRPPRSTLFPYTTPSDLLVDAVVNAVEHYNEIKPQLLTTGGTSDGRFIARMGAQVVELGPVNATIHKRSEERFSRNAETDIVCRLLLEKKKKQTGPVCVI